MKKRLVLFAILLVLPATLIGCATSGDLERVQTQQNMLDAKVQQALQDAQAAKAAAEEAKAQADAAKVTADATSARAEEAIKAAEERERIADEKAKQAEEAAFKRSMRK